MSKGCPVPRLLTTSLLLLMLAGCCSQRGFAPNEAGIVNFDVVDARLFRSAQPSMDSFGYLRSRGIQSVLNLRDDPLPGEKATALDHGMAYASLPLSGTKAPSAAKLREAMRLLESLPKPCLVHCQFGCERTGVVVGAYRVGSGWTVAQAKAEAKGYGMSPLYKGSEAAWKSLGR